jgi:hypothetical protein
MFPLQSGEIASVGPLVAVAFVAVGVGALVLLARPSLRRLFVMLRTPATPIGEIEPGRVEIEGTVVSAGETTRSRTSVGGSDEAVVTQWRQSDDEGRDFTLPVPQQFAPEFLNEYVKLPFYVEDDTGRILVDAARAEVSLKSDVHRGDNNPNPTQVEAFLEPGDEVHVLGEAVRVDDYAERAVDPSGPIRSLTRLVRGSPGTYADEVVDEDELVLTRTRGVDLAVSDAAGRRGLLRQALMAGFWTLSGLFVVVGGCYSLVLWVGGVA